MTAVIGICSISDPVASTLLREGFQVLVTGHTLVVDGANWQRRSLTNPPVVSVREQMGKGPFDAGG